MKALVFERKVAKFAAAAVAGRIAPGRGASVGPISLQDIDEPELPADGWVRVRPRLSGICGSDLATLDAKSSRYFEPIVSFPFTPGHEVVGELDDGRRVALIPILTCVARGIVPPCPHCAASEPNLCERIAFGHLEPGLQTGYCESTGGGWGVAFVAHESQLVAVPDDLTDEDAVMIEPTACAVNAVSLLDDGPTAIIGAGTIGLLVLAAARRRAGLTDIVVAAKHPAQQALARELGAATVVSPDALARAIRLRSHCSLIGAQLTGGYRNVVDCIGSDQSIAQALSVVAPKGRVLLVGMPGPHTDVDLTPLWHRQTELTGAYAYTRAHFDAAVALVRDLHLGRLVSATYPLARYRDAIDHAANAGARGAVKIAFDLRAEKGR
jgi:threonine dehydrogenase-like Zn-dependent dehydrogenase